MKAVPGKAVTGGSSIKTPKETDKDRIAEITCLQTVAKISTLFIAANIILIILCVLKLEVEALAFSNSGEKVVYFSYAIINIIHVIAIILLCIGVFTAKEQFVWAFLAVNGIWILVWALLQLFVSLGGQAKFAGYLTIGIGIVYGVLNIILEMLVYLKFSSLLKYRNNIPAADRAKFNVLSKTAMTSDMPMTLGQKGGATQDNSVTEVTLRF